MRWLGDLLHDPGIWHLHRRSVAGAFFIGLFCAFVPLPFHTVLAALLAIAFRCNLPISVALVWITNNPLTMAPIYYFAYRLGAWLLDARVEIQHVELSLTWLSSRLAEIWQPLLLGSLVCGWVAGVTGFVVVRVLWRLHVIRRWQERKAHRLARKEMTS